MSLKRSALVNKEKRKNSAIKIRSATQAKILDRGCARKKQYSNKNIAKLKATHARRKTGEIIEAYKCVYSSSHWHIGHQRRVAE